MEDTQTPGLDPGMELLQVAAALDVLAILHYAAEDGGQDPEIDRYGMGYLLSLLGERAGDIAQRIGDQEAPEARPKPRAVK